MTPKRQDILRRHESICSSLEQLFMEVKAEQTSRGRTISLQYIATWLKQDLEYLKHMLEEPTNQGFRLPYADPELPQPKTQ